MQVVNKVLSKWNKKTELANHKISLNLQADINKVLDEIEDSMQSLDIDAGVLQDKSYEIKLAMEEFDGIGNSYKTSAKNAQFDITNARKLKKKIEEIAKDLGVDPNGVKNYKVLNKQTDELEYTVKDVPNVIKEYRNFK